MTYNKPDNISFAQMAMWVDDHKNDRDWDTVTAYEYIYHLCVMLARKNNYFKTRSMVDKFGLYCASHYLARLSRKDLPTITHILNYIKSTIYGKKVDFLDDEYGGCPDDITIVSMENLNYYVDIMDDADPIREIEFTLSLDAITNIIHSYLSSIPNKRDDCEWENIYISCVLTLLDSLTPNKKQQMEINKGGHHCEFIYNKLKNSPPKLYHLPQSMSAYITVLVREIKRIIASNVGWREREHYSTDAAMLGIVLNNREDVQ